MITAIGEICAVCAGLGCLYLLLAVGVVLFAKPARSPQSLGLPEPVTVLKPLHGSEPRLEECLSSFCTQDYAAPMQLVLGLQDANDTALPVAREIRAKFPALPIVIKIDGTQHGTNAKVSNLINMELAAAHGILIAADSDILVGPHHIHHVVSLLQKPGAGAVSVLYRGVAAGGFWSQLSAIWINAQFLPNAVVGMTLNLAKPCFGSTIALRREMLAAIGGFEAFATQLADDYAIGEAVRNTGQSVEIGSFAVTHVCNEASARDFLRHQLRWARTIKTIDPAGYLGSFIAHPFAIAFLGIAAGNGSCVPIAALALGLRLLLCKTAERSFQFEARDYWLAPASDLISFGVYVWSFFGTAVTWKRARYGVLPDGTLAQSRQR